METATLLLRSEGRLAVETGRARALRESAKLSRAEWARALGVTPGCVSLWEAGRRLPRGTSAERLAVLLRELEPLADQAAGRKTSSAEADIRLVPAGGAR